MKSQLLASRIAVKNSNSSSSSSRVSPFEHLSWTSHQVVHSFGFSPSSAHRTYSFPDAIVKQAVFIDLSLDPTADHWRNSSTLGKATSFQRGDTLFGPFQPKPPNTWSDDPLPLPIHPPDITKEGEYEQRENLHRHLAVLLSTDDLHVYPDTPVGGGPFIIPLTAMHPHLFNFGSFPSDEHIEAVWRLPRGVLIESRNRRWHTLDDVKISPKSVGFADEIEETAEENIVEILTYPERPKSIIISVDRSRATLSAWTCILIPSKSKSVRKGKGKASPSSSALEPHGVEANPGYVVEEGASHDVNSLSSERAGSKRKRTISTMSTLGSRADASTSALMATSARSHSGHNRRISYSAPPQPSYHGSDTTEHQLLLEALASSSTTSASVGMKRNPTSSSSAGLPPEHRRTSVSRNELSVTMDRMALGQGGTSSQGLFEAGDRSWGPTPNGDMGSDEHTESSEECDWLVQRSWSMSFSTKKDLPPFDDMQAYLFDIRVDCATIGILLPQGQTLLLLSATEKGITPLHQLSASHACIVSHIRQNGVKDLLVRKPEAQGWVVIHATGRTESISLDAYIGDAEVDALESDGSNAVVVTTQAGLRIPITLPPNSIYSDEVAYLCMDSLSRVMDIDFFVDFEHAVRNHPTKRAWQAFADVVGREFGLVNEVRSEDRAAARLAEEQPKGRNYSVLSLLRSQSSPLSKPTTSRAGGVAGIRGATERARCETIVGALHLVAEELRLSNTKRAHYGRLARFVLHLLTALGAQTWTDGYHRQLGLAREQETTIPSNPLALLPADPPFIMDSLFRSLRVPATAADFSLFSLEKLWPKHNHTPSFFYGNSTAHPLRVTQDVVAFFSVLTATLPDDVGVAASVLRSQNIVKSMRDRNFTLSALDDLPDDVCIVLREALRVCQSDAPADWDEAAYELIRRPDLARHGTGAAHRAAEGEALQSLRDFGRPVDIGAISRHTKAGRLDEFLAGDGEMSSPKTIPAATVPKAVRFNEDRRLEEVARMLQFSNPVTIGGDRADRTLDQLTPQTQQSLLSFLSNRTLALPIGFALFTYRTKLGGPVHAVKVPAINTSARILPMSSPVALIEKESIRDASASGHVDRFEWPNFHAGVAAALQYQSATSSHVPQAESSGFDASSISLNKPVELESKHAGLLFGLGLSGHLDQMPFSQAFEYLKLKHDPTSIGILLGLAATYLGSGDSTVSSLLSVHLAALHPPNSSTLNVSGMTQAAALVGLGLLYLGSRKRTLADVMIRELCSIRVTMIEDASACREAYALSAGFSFGFIMLASGTDGRSSPGEVELLRTLRTLITGDGVHGLPVPPGSASYADVATDVSITSPAATIALALMYLRTERHDVASLLEIPDTARRLDYVRADLLLLRTLARSIILWDRIQLSKTWVDSHIPMFLTHALEEAKKGNRPADCDLEIARWNIVAGACFAIGLKYAGTAAAEAHGTLIHYLDRLTRVAYTKAPTVQSKIRRHAIRSCLSVVSVALSMVMAGTGEINVLRRLRVAHGHFGEGVLYGTHLASHMALGMLFVGGGQFTLGTSNAAIASLLLAFYPTFPPTPVENRTHLQAYRHLWTLAVEPRCLIARDIDTGESTFLPVRLRLVEPARATSSSTKTAAAAPELRAKQLVAPTLIPELKLIHTIQVDTPRYWSFALHLAADSPSTRQHLAAFLADRTTLWVKRKTGHLSYAQDPRGIRSIFTRSKSETGSSVVDLGQTAKLLSPSSVGLRDFVASFSNDIDAQAMTKWICNPSSNRHHPPSEWEAFAATVLLECLTRDKKDVAATYHQLYHSQHLSGLDGIAAQQQARSIIALYKDKVLNMWFGEAKNSKRSTSKALGSAFVVATGKEMLLQSTFIDHLESRESNDHASERSDSILDELLRQYVVLGNWPCDTSDSQQLAAYLSQSRAPSGQTLRSIAEAILEDPEYIIPRMQMLVAMVAESLGVEQWQEEFGQRFARILGSSEALSCNET